MKSKRTCGVAALAVMALFMMASLSFAADITVDFSSLVTTPINGDPFIGQDLGPITITDAATGLTAAGFYKPAGGNWIQTDLWARDSLADRGLGVCNPGEDDNCITSGGDYSELSDLVHPELIVLELPPGYQWSQVWISSLDNNIGGPPERGKLYAFGPGFHLTNQTPGALEGGTAVVKFEGADGGGGIFKNPDPDAPPFIEFIDFKNEEQHGYSINIPGAFVRSAVLAFEPFDWVNGTNNNNDFLVWKAVLTPAPCVPATLCSIEAAELQFQKRQVKWRITNTGSSTITLTGTKPAGLPPFTWPLSINGRLKKVKLGGHTLFDGTLNSPAALNASDFIAVNNHGVKPGHTEELILQFENQVSKSLADYSGSFEFGPSCVLQFPSVSASSP